jgi:hypothetical protein
MKAEQHIRTVEVHDRAGNVVGSKFEFRTFERARSRNGP